MQALNLSEMFRNLTETQDPTRYKCQGSGEFQIIEDDRVSKFFVSLVLWTIPLFSTLCPCQGTNYIESSRANLYNCQVVELSDLDQTKLDAEGIIVINATPGLGEVMARASVRREVLTRSYGSDISRAVATGVHCWWLGKGDWEWVS